jgi:hypothetical protein
VIARFRREVEVNVALLGCYAASSADFLPKFRDSPSVPFPGIKNPKKKLFLAPEILQNNFSLTTAQLANTCHSSALTVSQPAPRNGAI